MRFLEKCLNQPRHHVVQKYRNFWQIIEEALMIFYLLKPTGHVIHQQFNIQ